MNQQSARGTNPVSVSTHRLAKVGINADQLPAKSRGHSLKAPRAGIAVFAMLSLGLSLSAGAGGFPGGHREALGPRFEAQPGLQEQPKCQPPGHERDPKIWVRHWNEMAINAS